MALAQAALFVCRKQGILASSLTVDHGWRAESGEEARMVQMRLSELGASPALVTRVHPSGEGGPESAARNARYDALARVARENNACILLGHTADDQAETVLLGLGRGSGARSLAGMLPVGPCPGASDITIIRPFLHLRRSVLREALRSENVSWCEDPTNDLSSPVRTAAGDPLPRSAIRHRVLPELARSLGPGVVEALARTATQLQDDTSALDSIAAGMKIGENGQARLRDIRVHPRAIRTRILRSMALAAGARPGEITSWHIGTLDSLVMEPRGEKCLDLPGVKAHIRQGHIVFYGVDCKSGKECGGFQRYGSGSQGDSANRGANSGTPGPDGRTD